MRRAMFRLSTAGIGIAAFLFYASWAALTYWALRGLWANRPSAVGGVLVLAAATVLLGYASYRFGTARVLSSMAATPATPAGAPRFFRRLQRLCDRMDRPVPDVLIAQTGEPNAFAIRGARDGTIVLDVALIRLLTPAELDAVIAHELAHLESYDGLVQTLAFTGIQTVVLVLLVVLAPGILLLTGIAKGLAWTRGRPHEWTRGTAWQLQQLLVTLVMVGPLVVSFVLFARSRRREFAADRRAAAATGDPLALARALRKIEAAVRRELHLRTLFRGVGTEPDRDPLFWLLSTHPATERRIAHLVEMAREQQAVAGQDAGP